MAVALFDLDGTLTEGASCERRFVLHLAARGLLGGRQMAAAAGFALRHWPVYGRHVLKKDKAYGDSLHDLPLLTRVAHPVAVAPDAGLSKTARAAGWEILAPARAKEARARHFTLARQ